MHEGRIAGLEKRLHTLAVKRALGRFDPVGLDEDEARTRAELVALQGIRQRNLDWSAQAPEIQHQRNAAAERRRQVRENIQRPKRRLSAAEVRANAAEAARQRNLAVEDARLKAEEVAQEARRKARREAVQRPRRRTPAPTP